MIDQDLIKMIENINELEKLLFEYKKQLDSFTKIKELLLSYRKRNVINLQFKDACKLSDICKLSVDVYDLMFKLRVNHIGHRSDEYDIEIHYFKRDKSIEEKIKSFDRLYKIIENDLRECSFVIISNRFDSILSTHLPTITYRELIEEVISKSKFKF